jgi:uncharacterized protein
MRYWDSSAVVGLLVTQADSAARRSLLREDGQIVAWWGSRIECASALTSLARDGELDDPGLTRALANLEALADTWVEIVPSEEVRRRALRLLRLHPLRSADALQLAAALVASGEDPASLPLVTGESRLEAAARREGFTVY